MYFSIKRLFWIFFWGSFGFAISIGILILNKLIGYNISHSPITKNLDFTSAISNIASNRLTDVDFTIAFLGFLLVALLVFLSSRKYY